MSGYQLIPEKRRNIPAEIVAHLMSGVPTIADGGRSAQLAYHRLKIFDALNILKRHTHRRFFRLSHKSAEALYAERRRRMLIHPYYGVNDHYRHVVFGAGVQAAYKLIGKCVSRIAILPERVAFIEGRMYRLIHHSVFADERRARRHIGTVAPARKAGIKSRARRSEHALAEGLSEALSDIYPQLE